MAQVSGDEDLTKKTLGKAKFIARKDAA